MTRSRISLTLALALVLSVAVVPRERTAAQQKPGAPEALLGSALHQEEAEGNLEAAIAIYKKLISEKGVDRALAAKAHLHIGLCYEKLGNAEARKAYERVVREFADQPEEAKLARARLAALGGRDSAMRVRRIWAGPDVNIYGAPSRDGAYLTFMDWPDLALRDLATGQKRRLTNKDPRSPGFEFVLFSVPSPDSKLVAYAWWNKDNFFDLRIVGLDGSNPRVLYANPGVEYLVPNDWSPDGKNILAVFHRGDKGSQISLVSVLDGSVRVLKSFSGEAPQRARFSPDGRNIAYDFPQRTGSKEHDIFVLAVDGDHETPVVQHPANDVVFDWTPDGKRLLFGSDRSGTMGAWWIQIADGKPEGTPELVKPDLGQFTPMGFTRNGSYYYGVETAISDVYIAELDLATGKLLAKPSLATLRNMGSNDRPDWSADGRQLLYLSPASSGVWSPRMICVRDTGNGEVRELASKLNRVAWVRWSPDGRSLLVSAEAGLCRIDVQTGDFEQVVQTAFGWTAVWSRDGKAIFYHQWDPTTRKACIVVRDFATGQVKVLHSVAAPSAYYGGLALSRDGQQLAFIVNDLESGPRVLNVMPASGGTARELLREGRPLMQHPAVWTPDGLSLLFVRQHGPGDSKTDLWLISARDGEARKLDLTAEGMRDLCMHPDGRHVAFTAGPSRSEVWVMENFLPATK